MSKQWEEQSKKLEQESQAMQAKMEEQQLEFEKRMEDERIAMEKRFDSQFTTEVKITKADGSTLEMREKSEGGIVTEFINRMMPAGAESDPLISEGVNDSKDS